MEKCENIKVYNCRFYYSKVVRGFEALTPEYKEKVCHGDYTNCELWISEELSRLANNALKEKL